MDLEREMDVHVGVMVGVRVNVCVGIPVSVGGDPDGVGVLLKGTVSVSLSWCVTLGVALGGLSVHETVGVTCPVLVETVRECPVHMRLRLGLHVCVAVKRFVTV